MELEAAKMIGAGLAAIALAGAGVGIGIIFGNYLSVEQKLILGVALTTVSWIIVRCGTCQTWRAQAKRAMEPSGSHSNWPQGQGGLEWRDHPQC